MRGQGYYRAAKDDNGSKEMVNLKTGRAAMIWGHGRAAMVGRPWLGGHGRRGHGRPSHGRRAHGRRAHGRGPMTGGPMTGGPMVDV